MTDKDVIELVNGCRKETIDALDERLKSFATVILSDNQNIKDKISNVKEDVKEIKERVTNQNGAMRVLNEWKAGIEGGKVTVKNIVPWIAVVLTAIGLWFGISGKLKKAEEDMHNKLWWKQDRVLDSTTRSLKALPLDTAKLFKR